MADTFTEPGVGEDQRGKELAEKNRPGANHPDVTAGTDQAEAYANDPANATNKPKAPSDSTASKAGSAAATAASSGAGGAAGAVAAIGQFAGNHKKGAGITGAIAALAASAIIGLFGLLADKLTSVIENIYHHEMQKVENSLKKRTGKIVEKQLYNRIMNVAANSDNPAVQKLFNQIPTDKIEQALTNRGYKLTAEEGKLRLVGPNVDQTFGSASEFESYMSGASGLNAEAAVEASAEDATHFLETYQRRFLRLLLRDEFDAKPDKVYDDKTDDPNDPKDPHAATTEVTTIEEHAAIDPVSDTLGANVSCLTGTQGDCPANEEDRRFPDGNAEGHPTWEATEGQRDGASTEGSDPCNGDAKCESAGDIQGSGDQATFEKGLEAEAVKSSDNAVAKEFIKKVEGEVVKGGGVLATIGFLADADNIIYPDKTGHNKVSDVIIARREAQYAGEFNVLLKMDSEIRNGKGVSGDEVNATMKLLDSKTIIKDGKQITTPGIEDSRAFSTIFENQPTRGTPLASDSLVGSGGSLDDLDNIATTYQNGIGKVLHPVLAAYKSTIGTLTEYIGNALSSVISKLPGVADFTTWLGQYAAKFVNWLLGTVVDGSETGTLLMNAADAGGDVSANAFARDTLGAPAVSVAQAAEIDRQIAIQDAQLRSHQPLSQRLFDTTDPTSLTNQLAARMPDSMGAAADQTGSYLASLISNPIKFFGDLFSNRIFANALADPVAADPYGVQQFAYTNGQLSAPLDYFPPGDVAGEPTSSGAVNPVADGVVDQNDCPRVADANQANQCLLDTTALLSLTITSSTADNGGLGGGQ